VLFVELVVYVPIAVVQRASLEGFNYMADTLMYCGALLLLAGAMPRADQQSPSLSALAATELLDTRAIAHAQRDARPLK